MEGAYGGAPVPSRRRLRVADKQADYVNMDPGKLSKTIRELEQKMYRYADNLEFEDAARLRDEIEVIREIGLGLDSKKAG